MKNINQNLRFSIHASLLALLYSAMIPSTIASPMCQSGHNNADACYSSAIMAEQMGVPTRLLMVADNTDNDADKSESDADKEAAMQAKRQEMIDYCEDNKGVDCEKSVDTELEAQQLNHKAIVNDPDLGDNLPPRPRPRLRGR